MSKLNPFTMQRPKPVSETRTFTDPLQPGADLTLTLMARADIGELLRVQALTDQYSKEYADAMSVPLQVGGQDIEITPGLCAVIATIQALEQPTDGQRYSFEEWAALSVVMPTAMGEVIVWTRDLMREAATGPEVLGKDTPVPNE